MRKYLFALFVICALLLPILGHAQGDLILTTLDVNLWPEYDTPDMLVIYNFELPENTNLPVDVSFRIPPTAGQAFGFGYYPKEGSVPVQENYGQKSDGDWLLITFTMRSLRGTLEYYDPALPKNGEQRSYMFTWPGDYYVQTMTFIFQEPVTSQDIQLSVPVSDSYIGRNGLQKQIVEVGELQPKQIYSLEVDYKKSTSRLSVENMRVEPASPLPEGDQKQWLSWVASTFAIIGLLLIIGILSWYLLSQRRAVMVKKAPRQRKPILRSIKPASKEGSVYCHQCGQRAASGDRFCRSCGRSLRLE